MILVRTAAIERPIVRRVTAPYAAWHAATRRHAPHGMRRGGSQTRPIIDPSTYLVARDDQNRAIGCAGDLAAHVAAPKPSALGGGGGPQEDHVRIPGLRFPKDGLRHVLGFHRLDLILHAQLLERGLRLLKMPEGGARAAGLGSGFG